MAAPRLKPIIAYVLFDPKGRFQGVYNERWRAFDEAFNSQDNVFKTKQWHSRAAVNAAIKGRGWKVLPIELVFRTSKRNRLTIATRWHNPHPVPGTRSQVNV